MAHFLHSAASVLKNDASRICVSLVEGQETRWDLVAQASRSQLGLKSTQRFLESAYPGYVCKRNKTGQSFKNFATKKHMASDMKSFIYRFSPTADDVLCHEVTDCVQDQLDAQIVEMTATARKMTVHDKSRLDLSQAKIVVWKPIDRKQARLERRLARSQKLLVVAPQSPAMEHPSIDNVMYQCPECSKTFPTERGVQQHHHIMHVLQRYRIDPDAHWPCSDEQCGRIFSRKEDMDQHYISKHTALSPAEQSLVMGAEVYSISIFNAQVMSRVEMEQSGLALRLVGSDVSAKIAPEDLCRAESVQSERYQYIPCPVCGQAIVDFSAFVSVTTNADGVDYGMLLHLESLKPVLGLKMTCPLTADGWCKTEKTFMERRALEQHFRRCREHKRRHFDNSQ